MPSSWMAVLLDARPLIVGARPFVPPSDAAPSPGFDTPGSDRSSDRIREPRATSEVI
jgi:hypothetical protein